MVAILTIASGAVSLGNILGIVSIAAETGTADNLDTINSLKSGATLVLVADTGDTITLRNNAPGNIRTSDGSNIDMTDTTPVLLNSDGTLVYVTTIGGGAGSGAPTTAHYLTSQAESGLSAEVNLGLLTTGMLKHDVTAGVSTPATASAGTDYVTPTGTENLSNKTFLNGIVVNEDSSDSDSRFEGNGDANLLFVDAGNDNIGMGISTPDASAKLHVVSTSKGSIAAPVMTAAQMAAISSPAEGLQAYASDTDLLNIYDAQRFRAVQSMGWQPRAWPLHVQWSGAATSVALAANGGSIAIPILVVGHMLLQSVTLRSADTATARTWGWDLYVQYLNNGNAGENTLARIAACASNETFTPSAASNRTVDAGSAPIYLPPGIYWLVAQNRHATNTFAVQLATGVMAGDFDAAGFQTKTTTNPNGATLDFVAATWTKETGGNSPYAKLNGRVFGQTAAF